MSAKGDVFLPPRSKGTEFDEGFGFLPVQQESSALQHSLHNLVQLEVGQQGAFVGQHSLQCLRHGSPWTGEIKGKSRRTGRIMREMDFMIEVYR